MFGIFKKKSHSPIYAMVDGHTVSLDSVNDPTFSQKLLGDGVAIAPTGTIIVAPCSGKITTLPDTYHAFGMQCDNGLELLIHVGIDTVSLKGECFSACAQVGQQVKVGDPILCFDLAELRNRGFDCTTMLIVLNHESHPIHIPSVGTRVQIGQDIVLEQI